MACHRTTTAPEPATVPVEWHWTTSDTSSEHACHIGDRHTRAARASASRRATTRRKSSRQAGMWSTPWTRH